MGLNDRTGNPSLYSQPLAIRFGSELVGEIGKGPGIEPFWDSLDIAVAWVRASGTTYLAKPLAKFLKHGGQLSVTVGIDLENTTREGLQGLLNLEKHGQCETYVYHNESGSIFHPKVYLFRNEEEARLIVGSNNITQAGLYVNVEAGLQVETSADAKVITEALRAVNAWKNTDDQLALRLDADILDRLVDDGYVPDEASTSAARKRTLSKRKSSGKRPLFGSRRYPAPPRPDRRRRRPGGSAGGTTEPETEPGAVVLMRLRKASTTERPTQTQLPFRIADTFFRNTSAVRSSHSNERHPLVTASARGGRNTVKLEIPEMRDFRQPVARFHRTETDVEYEVYDADTPEGTQIMAALQAGKRDRSTQQSVSDTKRATWWRYI